MDEQVVQILVSEIQENRAEIRQMRKEIHTMDKHVFSNKMKLTLFITGVGLAANLVWVVILHKIKDLFT